MIRFDSGQRNIAVTKRERRLGVRDELILAMLPTLTILGVLAFIDDLSNQRLLVGSLAASAFLIYLDPGHPMNKIEILMVSHLVGLVAGIVTCWIFGAGYLAAGVAMVITIVIMVVGDFVFPPAVSTSLIFGLRSGEGSLTGLFAIALVMIAILVILERAAIWLLRHLSARDQARKSL